MGQNIGWYRLGEPFKSGGIKTPWADDTPDEFSQRFDGRSAWWLTILDVAHETVITCGCCKNGYTYGCDTPSVFRPKDFPEFRKALRKAKLTRSIFQRMTDWLESHPDVYVDFG